MSEMCWMKKYIKHAILINLNILMGKSQICEIYFKKHFTHDPHPCQLLTFLWTWLFSGSVQFEFYSAVKLT